MSAEYVFLIAGAALAAVFVVADRKTMAAIQRNPYGGMNWEGVAFLSCAGAVWALLIGVAGVVARLLGVDLGSS